jgi:hypothetical protein
MSIKFDDRPSLPLRLTTLGVVTLAIMYSTLLADTLGPGTDVASVSRRYQSLFTPAPFAFAIWGVIYGGFLAVCVASLLPSRRGMPIYDRIARPLMLANLLGALWIATFQGGFLVTSVVISIAMLVVAAWMFEIVSRTVEVGLARFALTAPFALFLGWMGVAVLANIGAALVANGYAGFGPGARASTVVALCIAAAASLAVGVRWRQFVVPAVVAWAAYAIAVADRNVDPPIATTAILIAAICSGAALWIGLRRTQVEQPRDAWPAMRGRRTG